MNLFQHHKIQGSEYLARRFEAEKRAKEKSALILDIVIEFIIWLVVVVCSIKFCDFVFVFCVGGMLATFIHTLIRI